MDNFSGTLNNLTGFLGLTVDSAECLACGANLAGGANLACGANYDKNLCKSCGSQLILVSGDSCIRCGRYLDWEIGAAEKSPSSGKSPAAVNSSAAAKASPSSGAPTSSALLCPVCASKKTYFDMIISCFEYNGLCKELLHRLKYSNERELAQVFGEKMAETAGEVLFSDSGQSFLMRTKTLRNDRKFFDNTLLIPVPVSDDKMVTRGYNQALCLAEVIGRITGLKVVDGLLRIKDTQGQHGLTKVDRNKNIEGAFSFNLEYNISYRHIILVDDIFTTGSTAQECSRILKEAGCSRVTVLTAAGGGRKNIRRKR